MELNPTLLKIQKILDERQWSLYKLSHECGIAYSSLNSLFKKNNQPTISTLEKICAGLHITLAEFFLEHTPKDEICDITRDELHLIHTLRSLKKRDYRLLLDFIELLRNR